MLKLMKIIVARVKHYINMRASNGFDLPRHPCSPFRAFAVLMLLSQTLGYPEINTQADLSLNQVGQHQKVIFSRRDPDNVLMEYACLLMYYIKSSFTNNGLTNPNRHVYRVSSVCLHLPSKPKMTQKIEPNTLKMEKGLSKIYSIRSTRHLWEGPPACNGKSIHLVDILPFSETDTTLGTDC